MKDTTLAAYLGMILLWITIVLSFWGGIAYLAIHFIRKFW